MRVCSGFPVRVASALLALAAATGVGAASLTASQVSEAQVKAAFLLNFTRFVEWPATFTGPLTICVAADDAFVDSVRQSVRGQSAAGHELRARQLHPGDSPENCQVVFVGFSDPVQVAEQLRQIRGPVLTVGETIQFLRDGGIIRVFVEDSKVRFQIDHRAAEAAGLKVSSQLLRLSSR